MKLARCQCLDAKREWGKPRQLLMGETPKTALPPQDRAASLPRKMPIPRQDAYSTGATQGREQSLAALEART